MARLRGHQPQRGCPRRDRAIAWPIRAAAGRSLRAVRTGRHGTLLLGVTATTLLAIGYLVLQGVEFTQWRFTPDVNAYTSAFGTLVGLQAAFVLIGLIITTVVMLQSWLGYFDSW